MSINLNHLVSEWVRKHGVKLTATAHADLQGEIAMLLQANGVPPQCEHVMTRYIRDCSMCESCGAILTDGTWGAQSGKWFKSYTEALQEHNR
jgi:hypothetical protein